MEVLSSLVLIRPTDLATSRRFDRDQLGLAVFREFCPADRPPRRDQRRHHSATNNSHISNNQGE